jgi:predicted metalloendopeptidase
MERANAVADRAGRIKLLDDLNVQGKQQITEIIADTEGFRLALDLAKKEESFDYDAFFRAYARYNNWYYSDRETYRRTFTIEVHPAPVFRVNFTVQLTDEFYETYPSVTEGTPMYLPPEERELVW